MVGHTGVIPAAITAVETVDACLGRVVQAVHEAGGACVITADHGNAEHMREADGSPNTAHSLNRVPLIVTARGVESRRGGEPGGRRPHGLDAIGDDGAGGNDRPLAARAAARADSAGVDMQRGQRDVGASADERRPGLSEDGSARVGAIRYAAAVAAMRCVGRLVLSGPQRTTLSAPVLAASANVS